MNIFYQKRVALLGPAPHIVEFDQTRRLRDFDIIVRMNLALPLAEKVKRCTTDRCDVLYIRRKVYPVADWHNVKQVRIDPKALWGPDFLTDRDVYEPWKEKIIFLGPYYLKKGWVAEMGSNPNMGMVAIADILDNHPAQLYVSGLTFYQGPLYHPDYAARVPLETRQGMEAGRGTAFGHDQFSQIRYFKKHFAHRVKVDWVLAEILQDFKDV